MPVPNQIARYREEEGRIVAISLLILCGIVEAVCLPLIKKKEHTKI